MNLNHCPSFKTKQKLNPIFIALNKLELNQNCCLKILWIGTREFLLESRKYQHWFIPFLNFLCLHPLGSHLQSSVKFVNLKWTPLIGNESQKKTWCPSFYYPNWNLNQWIHHFQFIHTQIQSKRTDQCCVNTAVQVFKLVVLDPSINYQT